ncbi:hypothetical protein COLU111180_17175 [Cohnella lubricantis]|uniref:Uncharacterized protein n=1 Tax=Cohnella lubricantis TaxID=2163172 RepID=A0A841TKR1_9BACL|nr:hypothetical protein [Cohnella lubricantis]MBB6679778.1 hypothetical protein [Cohnella lubricantis]MBP2119951.1 hypothetical protein [Cohnella lubricantis]
MLINDNDALTIWKKNELELLRQLERRRLASLGKAPRRRIGRFVRFAANLLSLR